MDNPDFVRIKEYISRFMTFSDEEWSLFVQQLEKQEIPKGKYVMEAGEVCNFVAFINKGHVRSFCVVHDEELTYNFFFDGNFFSDYASFVSREPSIETIQALDHTELLMLSYESMQMLYEKTPVWQKFGRIMAEYTLIRASQRNKSILFLSAEERYLNLMKARPKVIANIPQHYIASYLGIKPESLSRIRKRLAESKRLV